MRIVFFGTPEFSIPSLDILLKNDYQIVGVVTAPDKEKGRGLRLDFSPVKKFALSKNLILLQPGSLKDLDFQNQLKELQPDLGIVVAYRILPKEVYTIPQLGTFNLHASLLPKYRGAAPIQWVLINGEKVTGVTTFFLEEKVDTGNIILQKEVPIDDEDNFQTLHDKLAIVGSQLVIETVKLIETGKYELIPQDESLATPAPKITKEICRINWFNKAQEIHNLIRALTPTPGAFTIHNGKIIKIYKSKITDLKSTDTPGKIVLTKNEIFVNTGDYYLSIFELQPESRRRMTVSEFLLGYKNLLIESPFFS